MKNTHSVSKITLALTLALSFSLTSCGKTVNSKTRSTNATPQSSLTGTSSNMSLQNDPRQSVDPFNTSLQQNQNQSQQQQQQQQTTRRKNGGSSGVSRNDILNTNHGSVRSCSMRVNGGAIETGVLAVGLTVGAAFVGPLLFVPALISAIKSNRYVMSKDLMRAAMKIVYSSSNDNQLVDYSASFLDHKKKNLNTDEKSAFGKAKKSLEKALSKELKGSISVPDVEFAERVFTYDLRGSLCEGGIKAFSETKEIISNLVLLNHRVIRPAPSNGCHSGC